MNSFYRKCFFVFFFVLFFPVLSFSQERHTVDMFVNNLGEALNEIKAGKSDNGVINLNEERGANGEGASRSIGPVVCDDSVFHDDVVEKKTVKMKSDLMINFDTDSDAIRPSSFLLIKDFASALRVYERELLDRGVTVCVVGHTDSRGSNEYNMNLSKRRAAAVLEYLVVNFDFPPSLFDVSGKGENEPEVQGNTSYAYRKNRRVEVYLRK